MRKETFDLLVSLARSINAAPKGNQDRALMLSSLVLDHASEIEALVAEQCGCDEELDQLASALSGRMVEIAEEFMGPATAEVSSRTGEGWRFLEVLVGGQVVKVRVSVAEEEGTRAVQCECGVVTGTPCAWKGPCAETVLVACNSGIYPRNGSIRMRVGRSCYERLREDADLSVLGGNAS